MAFACIDVGSNTTRLLVAELRDGRLREVHAERDFTRLGRSLIEHGRIPPQKVAESALAVARQADRARALGASRVDVVGTAVLRQAPNATELVAAVERACGLRLRVLPASEEARLAFRGAVGTHERRIEVTLAVLDVGGWSTEVAVGTAAGGVARWVSLPLGSGLLADLHLRRDPPRPEQLEAMRARVRATLGGVELSGAACAIVVGAAAGSLPRLAGRGLSLEGVARGLEILCAAPAAEVAARVGMHAERVRLMPAGLILLDELARRLGAPLEPGHGGLREGVVLELADVAG
ncbi:MAG: hypothetical protein IRZ21_08570 [Thermoleophilaceae bacterium]|nr:hypothetical protein [Thermoleophilaceae bacterium]